MLCEMLLSQGDRGGLSMPWLSLKRILLAADLHGMHGWMDGWESWTMGLERPRPSGRYVAGFSLKQGLLFNPLESIKPGSFIGSTQTKLL